MPAEKIGRPRYFACSTDAAAQHRDVAPGIERREIDRDLRIVERRAVLGIEEARIAQGYDRGTAAPLDGRGRQLDLAAAAEFLQPGRAPRAAAAALRGRDAHRWSGWRAHAPEKCRARSRGRASPSARAHSRPRALPPPARAPARPVPHRARGARHARKSRDCSSAPDRRSRHAPRGSARACRFRPVGLRPNRRSAPEHDRENPRPASKTVRKPRHRGA